MIKYLRFAVLLALCVGIMACQSNKKNTRQEPYRKKIYLTEQDYLDDLSKEAAAERREAKPNPESNYVFNVLPETPKNVYFFDERVQPKIPGVPSEREYKNTKRLWQKPRRFSPDQYYGDGGAPAASASNDSGSTSSSYEDSYDYD
ncbi:MAG: hypothetical protein J6U96_05555 [Elusimicrobiaceae bacterium]|nr:hypothetical protein [Elusimicrobiaceae bacterium]